jgi:hypothetical protein
VNKNIEAIQHVQDISKLINGRSLPQLDETETSTTTKHEDGLPEFMKEARPKINNKHIMKICNLNQKG